MATKNPFGQLRVVDRDEDEEVAQKVSKTTPAATLFSNAQTEQKKKKKVRPDEKKQSEEHPVQESTEGFQVVRKNKQKPRTFEPVKEGDFEDKKSINPKVHKYVYHDRTANFRPGKRIFERHSGTGRGKEIAKGGAGGNFIWGDNTEMIANQVLKHDVDIEDYGESTRDDRCKFLFLLQ